MNFIASEPARLQAEQHRIKKELAATGVEHHAVLVQASERAGKVAAITDVAATLADKSEESLTRLKAQSNALQDAGYKWRREREGVTVAMNSAAKIAELLDAPATLDACIRSEMYHEARLLIDHIANLADAMPESPVMLSVAQEVHATLVRLVSQVVLPRLGGNLTVAVALKITTFLRQMGVEEDTLREAFLQARTEFVQSFVAEEEVVDAAMPATLLKRLLWHWKLVVSDVIVTYSGCFSASAESSAAISQWALERTHQLLNLFQRYLPAVTSGVELADISAEVSHGIPSWTAVGIDVSTRLYEMIADRVAELFLGHISAGQEAFTVAMANASWKHTRSKASDSGPPSSLSDGAPSPPTRLVHCLPLTYIAHSIVTACNDIRRCAALPAWPRCYSATEALIQLIVDEVRVVKEDVHHGEDLEAANALTAIATQDCIPFICRCVDYVFDVQTLSETVAVNAMTQIVGRSKSTPSTEMAL